MNVFSGACHLKMIVLSLWIDSKEHETKQNLRFVYFLNIMSILTLYNKQQKFIKNLQSQKNTQLWNVDPIIEIIFRVWTFSPPPLKLIDRHFCCVVCFMYAFSSFHCTCPILVGGAFVTNVLWRPQLPVLWPSSYYSHLLTENSSVTLFSFFLSICTCWNWDQHISNWRLYHSSLMVFSFLHCLCDQTHKSWENSESTSWEDN